MRLKDRKRGPEGDEWEPVKIPHGNSTSIPNSTRHASLLARPQPHSYREAIGPWNWVRNQKTQRKAQIVARKATSEATAVKIDREDFSHSHRHFIEQLVCVRETTMEAQ
jgi:hypothetical protein